MQVGSRVSGYSPGHHVRVLPDNPYIGHGEIGGCGSRLLPVPKRAYGNTEARGEFGLRQPQRRTRAPDQSRPLSPIQSRTRDIEIFGIEVVSRDGRKLVAHLHCSVAPIWTEVWRRARQRPR